jgi:hypothetical protein
MPPISEEKGGIRDRGLFLRSQVFFSRRAISRFACSF